jgi:hypothetical protein
VTPIRKTYIFQKKTDEKLIISNREYYGFAKPKSIKQWLVAPSWISPLFGSFEKKLLLNYFFLWIGVFKPKFQMKIDWIMEHSCLTAFLNFSAILKCYFSELKIFYFYGSNYQNISLDQLIAHITAFSCNCSLIISAIN